MKTSTTYILMGFLLWSLWANAWAASYFTEVYPVEDSWRVDHFQLQTGKLQDLISSRTFRYRFQAEAFAKTLKVSTEKSMTKFVSTEVSATPLWKVSNSWNQDWENKYAQWIEKNLDVDFFVRYNFKTDCADVAYALRWIFSRDHQLPASATLAGSNVTVTQETMRSEWAFLPTNLEWHKDQRFLSAMAWLLDNVYTKTLYLDSYPVELRKETIQAGLIHLTGVSGSHTEVFSKVSNLPGETPLEVMSSTLPVMVRKLDRRIFLDGTVSDQKFGGLLKFRWPVKIGGKWTVVAKLKMPYHSLEQYEETPCGNSNGLAKCIFQRLGIVFEPKLIVKKLILGHEEIIKSRLAWVKDGYEYCRINDCSLGTQGYEDHGTPSRDKRITDNFKIFREQSSELGLETMFDNWEANTLVPGLVDRLTMRELRNRLEAGFVSSDPRDSVGARWALGAIHIQETVAKKYQASESLRSDLLSKAAGCRLKPEECKSSLKSFNELSSAEIDSEMQNLLGSWVKYCSAEMCPANPGLSTAARLVWKRSPAPWDPVSLRSGQNSEITQGHMLVTTDVSAAGKNFIILDESRLYDIKSRSFKKLFEGPGFLKYDASLDLITAFTGNEMSLYDQSLQLRNKINLPFHSDTFKFHSFNNGKILAFENDLLNTCCRPSQPWIVDLTAAKVEQLPLAVKILFPSKGRDTFLFVGVGSNLLIDNTADGLITTELPLIEDLMAFEVLDDHILLATRGTGRHAGFYSASGWQTIMEGDSYINLYPINSYFYAMETYSMTNMRSSSWIIGKDRKFIMESGNFIASVSVSREKRIGSMDSKAYLFDGPVIKEIAPLDVYQVLSAWEGMLSVNQYSGPATVMTFEGEVIDSSPWFEKMNCYPHEFNSTCFDPDESLLLERYKLPAEGLSRDYISYYQVGLRDKLRIKDSYAYIIEKSFSMNSSQAYETTPTVDVGSAIKLKKGLLLWFPEKI